MRYPQMRAHLHSGCDIRPPQRIGLHLLLTIVGRPIRHDDIIIVRAFREIFVHVQLIHGPRSPTRLKLPVPGDAALK